MDRRHDLYGRDRWATSGRRDVVPEQVEYPEFVFSHSSLSTFERGEIVAAAPSLKEQLEQVQTPVSFTQIRHSYAVPMNDDGKLNESLGRNLTLGELLGALYMVVCVKANDVLAPGTAVIGGLAADLEIDGEPSTVQMDETVEDAIRDRIDTMTEKISAEYVNVLERRPSLRELLASVDFVLGSRAEEYLDAGGEFVSVRRIYATERT